MVEQIKNNTFQITGNLAKDPKEVQTKNGVLVIATLAIYNGTDPKTQEPRPAIFQDISLFGKVGQQSLAFKKGQKLNIKGSLNKTKKPLMIKGEEIKHDGKPIMIERTVLTGYAVSKVVIQTQKPKTNKEQVKEPQEQEMGQ